MKIALALAFAVAAFATVPASAVTHDVATAYDGVSNPAGPWTFGYTDSGFTSFTSFGTGGFTACQPQLSCLLGGVEPALGAYKNISGMALVGFGTVDIPANALFLHPGTSLISAVTFTAPTSAVYSYAVTVRMLTNTNPTGVDVFTGNLFTGPVSGGLLTSLPATLGASYSFSGGIALTAGQSIILGIGPAGNYQYDSTQLEWTMSTVPEPANWAMLIAGFGLTGAAMRRRRAVAITA